MGFFAFGLRGRFEELALVAPKDAGTYQAVGPCAICVFVTFGANGVLGDGSCRRATTHPPA
jgi:hypothetical protein